MSRLNWIVGRGLLGSHVALELARRRALTWAHAGSLPWADPAAHRALEDAVQQFARESRGRPWRILWCAGAGVVGTQPEALAAETRTVAAFLEMLDRHLEVPNGALFLASSAGGVWAGSPARPPFTEDTPAAPLSAYGREKLAQEELVRSWAAPRGVPVLVGRISNLYGPGQDLSKPQGLISHACRSVILGIPLTIWVSLDTIRDYVFAPDCARMVVDAAERLETDGSVTKILASGQGSTVATVLGTFRNLLRRAVRLRFAVRAATQMQARDLRVKSVVWPELAGPATPLHVGMHHVVRDLQARYLSGSLHHPGWRT